MSNKKLGWLLLPFVPLTAIGIVEVASSIMPAKDAPAAAVPICEHVPATVKLVEPPAPPPAAAPQATISF